MVRVEPVALVGAGPGDPELLTMKAHRLLQGADVVVCDRLVSPEVQALIPASATRIDVGKEPRRHPVPQSEINDLLVRLARAGRKVVRLKGGDPFTFGRGSEEALALAAQGIPYEVVPGITSASGCAAAVGMPLTHRGLASGVRFVTGHCREDMDLDLDWSGLADPDTTLVIYMGRANLDQITDRLICEGLGPQTPAAAVFSGTTPRQRVVTSTLAAIAGDVATVSQRGPVLFIVGQVVALGEMLRQVEQERWLDDAAVGEILSA